MTFKQGTGPGVENDLKYPYPAEFERLVSACGLAIVSPDADVLFARAARQAAALCGAPIGLLTLRQEGEEAVIGGLGVGGYEGEVDEAFCAHTLLQNEPVVVEDTQLNLFFAGLPLVTQAPHIRFYASAPVLDRSGMQLGCLCVLDTIPRELSTKALLSLERLATMISVVLEARRAVVDTMAPDLQYDGVQIALKRLDLALDRLFDQSNGFKVIGGRR